MSAPNDVLDPQSTDNATEQNTAAQDASGSTQSAPTQAAPIAPEPGAPEVGTPAGNEEGRPSSSEADSSDATEVPNQASPVTSEESADNAPEGLPLEAEVPAETPLEPASNQASPVADEKDTSAPALPYSGKASMKGWWESQPDSTKEFAELRDDNTLVLKATAGQPERTLATLSADGRDATLKALLDKHSEVKDRVEKLRTDWDAAPDKGKLGGRVSMLREYLANAPSLGDYSKLYTALEPMESELSRHAEASYAARLALVEEAEGLAESSDWKATTTALRDMTDRWKAAPPLEKSRADELWGRLEKARDKFFERKRLAAEETDKELMNNLAAKLELVDKAEALAASEEWRKTTEELKGLMEQWKSVGRAAGGRDEELWARFSQAKTVFFDRKKAHFDTIQKEQEENLAKKLELLDKAEAIQDSTDWNKTSAEFEAILQDWRRVGKVPIEKADEIRDRMERAKDTFFGARRAHFETVKVSLSDNYAQKLALLKRAESLKHSTQWRETTGEFAELMEEWKRIGPVPREHSRKMWTDFMAARSFFFERKDADRERRNERFHQHAVARVESQRGFLHKLEDELREEQENLTDFRTSLENVSGPKAKELREHLTKLIVQSEERIARKEQKLEQVRKEVEALKEPAPAPDRNRGRERGRDDRKGDGRAQAAKSEEPKAGERAQEFSPEVPAGMPVEEAPEEAVVFTPSEEVSEDNPSSGQGSLASNEETSATDGSENSSGAEAATANSSPDAVKNSGDLPASAAAEQPAPAANMDVVTPSAAEQNAGASVASGPDHVPSSETATPPMQTGEDNSAIDGNSATIDG